MRVRRLQVYPPGRDYHIVAYSSIDVMVQTETGYAVIIGMEWLFGILAKNRAEGVRGHEKVPVCGQVQVPAGGQLKVPIPRFVVSSGLPGPGR